MMSGELAAAAAARPNGIPKKELPHLSYEDIPKRRRCPTLLSTRRPWLDQQESEVPVGADRLSAREWLRYPSGCSGGSKERTSRRSPSREAGSGIGFGAGADAPGEGSARSGRLRGFARRVRVRLLRPRSCHVPKPDVRLQRSAQTRVTHRPRPTAPLGLGRSEVPTQRDRPTQSHHSETEIHLTAHLTEACSEALWVGLSLWVGTSVLQYPL